MQASYQITQQQLQAVRRRSEQDAVSRGERRAMAGDGRLVQRIPREAFWNAVVNHGVSPQDSEYWNDMARIYPETAVKTQHGIAVHFGERGSARPRNRFGRVSFRKVYA